MIPLQIVDEHKRIHNYLRISLTERCNLRCFYCMPKEGVDLTPSRFIMSSGEVKDIASTFVDLGINKIRLTGGEPLVRKDAAEIITNLATLPVELAITTNGIVLDRYLDVLKEANLNKINISLDSLNKDKFHKITRRDYFDRVWKNTEMAIASGLEVKINVVLMKGVNDDEIVDFVNLTKDYPIEVRFIEYMPFDGNKWSWEKVVSQEEIMNTVTASITDEIGNLDMEDNGTARKYHINGYQGDFGVISSVTNPFCDTCNRIRLTANGRLKNCLFSTSETDILTPFRKGENITPYIIESIKSKKGQRGGMVTNQDFSNPEKNQNNRSMVLIGG